MEIKKTITLELSEHDVQEIIAEYLNKQGYSFKASDVSLVIGSKWTIYGASGETKEYYFEAARVKYKEK